MGRTDDIFLFITNVINPISILACLWLFFRYNRVADKGIGIKMVLILSLSDFIFHVTTLINAHYKGKQIIFTLLSSLIGVSIKFSIFWTCNMAFFLHKLLMREVEAISSYLKKSLVLILSLSIGLSIM